MNSPEKESKDNDEFLERVRDYWSKKSGKELTLEDTEQILENTIGLLSQFPMPGRVRSEFDQEVGGSKLTVDEAGRIFAEVFQTSITKDGPNYTFSLVWPDEAKDRSDPKRLGAIFVDRLIVYFEENFFRTLTREVALDMMDFLSDS